MAYFVLLVRERPALDAKFAIHFGDKERECVEFERDDLAEGHDPIAKRWTKIVSFARVPSQRQLDEKLAELNEGMA